MLEAAVRGIVDFREAKLFDPAWGRRLDLLLRGLYQQNRREELLADVAHYRELLLIPRLKEEGYTTLSELMHEARQSLTNAFRPWITPATKEELTKAAVTEATQAWESKYGKLSDPETQAKIAKTAEAMRKQRELNAEHPSGDDLATDRQKRAAKRAAAGRPKRRREDAVGRILRTPTRRKPVSRGKP